MSKKIDKLLQDLDFVLNLHKHQDEKDFVWRVYKLIVVCGAVPGLGQKSFSSGSTWGKRVRGDFANWPMRQSEAKHTLAGSRYKNNRCFQANFGTLRIQISGDFKKESGTI